MGGGTYFGHKNNSEDGDYAQHIFGWKNISTKKDVLFLGGRPSAINEWIITPEAVIVIEGTSAWYKERRGV